MKMFGIATALVAAGGLGLSAVPASAQVHSERHVVVKHTERHVVRNDNRRRTVCKTVWRNHHKVRQCRTVRR